MQTVQRTSGGVVALITGALLVFAVDKGAQPSSPVIYYILGGVLACASAIWVTLFPLGRLRERVDQFQRERDLAISERDTLRGEREALRESSATLRTERDQTEGALRHLQAETETTGEPRLPMHIHNRVIRLDELPPWVLKRTFEECEIVGPGPAWIGPSIRRECTLLGIGDDSFVAFDDMSALPEGGVRFIDCSFVKCELQSFVMAGTARQIARLREEFKEH